MVTLPDNHGDFNCPATFLEAREWAVIVPDCGIHALQSERSVTSHRLRLPSRRPLWYSNTSARLLAVTDRQLHESGNRDEVARNLGSLRASGIQIQGYAYRVLGILQVGGRPSRMDLVSGDHTLFWEPITLVDFTTKEGARPGWHPSSNAGTQEHRRPLGSGADPVATSLIHGYRPIITLFKANSKPSKE